MVPWLASAGRSLYHRLFQHLRGTHQLLCLLFPHPGSQAPHPAWAAFFAVVSMIIANAGLDQILTISVPILNILYPSAIVLTLLSFLPGSVQKLWAIYPVGIAFTGVASILYTLQDLKVPLFWLESLLNSIPLADVGLGWVLPAVIGILLGGVLSTLCPRTAE